MIGRLLSLNEFFFESLAVKYWEAVFKMLNSQLRKLRK